MNECIQSNQSQLTDDHEGEKVSIEEVQQDWLVPRFHADHSSDQINEGNGLEGDGMRDSKLLELACFVFHLISYFNLCVSSPLD